jgi:hypothetical protein
MPCTDRFVWALFDHLFKVGFGYEMPSSTTQDHFFSAFAQLKRTLNPTGFRVTGAKAFLTSIVSESVSKISSESGTKQLEQILKECTVSFENMVSCIDCIYSFERDGVCDMKYDEGIERRHVEAIMYPVVTLSSQAGATFAAAAAAPAADSPITGHLIQEYHKKIKNWILNKVVFVSKQMGVRLKLYAMCLLYLATRFLVESEVTVKVATELTTTLDLDGKVRDLLLNMLSRCVVVAVLVMFT